MRQHTCFARCVLEISLFLKVAPRDILDTQGQFLCFLSVFPSHSRVFLRCVTTTQGRGRHRLCGQLVARSGALGHLGPVSLQTRRLLLAPRSEVNLQQP